MIFTVKIITVVKLSLITGKLSIEFQYQFIWFLQKTMLISTNKRIQLKK